MFLLVTGQMIKRKKLEQRSGKLQFLDLELSGSQWWWVFKDIRLNVCL